MKPADEYSLHKFALNAAIAEIAYCGVNWEQTRNPIWLCQSRKWLKTARYNLAACERLARSENRKGGAS